MNTKDPMGRLRATGIAFALLVGAAALSGCTVTVADPVASPSSGDRSVRDAPVSGGDETGADDPDAGEGAAGDDVSAAPDATSEQMENLHRTTWTDRVEKHLVCTSDPFTLDNLSDGAVVEIAGDCGDVTILAHAGVVLVPAVASLTVDGDGGVVIVESADEITLTSDATLLGWESGTPRVSDQGYLNITTPID